MRKQPVHYLHVKYRGEIFTFSYLSDVIPMSELNRLIKEIKEFCNDSQR